MAVATSGGDVVVIGAGAAGSAAALAAARGGANVYLLEAGAQPGGTVAHSLIHTIGGLYDSTGNFLQEGLVQELVDELAQEDSAVRPRQMGRTWVLSVCPDNYQTVLERWLANESRITLVTRAHIDQFEMLGGSVNEVRVTWPGGQRRLSPQAVIDATGTAEIIRRLDSSFLHGTNPTAAGGLMIRLRGVAPDALKFPNGIAIVRALRAAVLDGELPSSCRQTWVDSGVYDDEVYLKMFVTLPADWQSRRRKIVEQARQGGAAAVKFLRRRLEFANCRIERVGALGVREGGRIRGEYCLTREDVRAGRKFADAACRCAWPIEFWDPEQGVLMEYQPAGSWFEIPLRALKLAGMDNVWAVGKCLSADPQAQAAARVVGCCWGMGQAVGQLVAQGVAV